MFDMQYLGDILELSRIQKWSIVVSLNDD